MENKNRDLSPEEQLNLVESSQRSVELKNALDFGPWWYAIFLGSGLSIIAADFNSIGLPTIFGLILLFVPLIHESINKSVKINFKDRFSKVRYLISFSSSMLAVVSLVAWSGFINSEDPEGKDLYIWIGVGAIVFTIMFLVLRAVLLKLAKRLDVSL